MPGLVELRGLISTMSQGEKRFFSVFSQRHSPNKVPTYKKLYDQLCAKGEPESSHSSARQAVDRTYLYEQLLTALHQYHRDSSVEARLHRALHQVELLYNRGTHKLATRLLTKTRRSAEQSEAHLCLLEAIRWEKTLLSADLTEVRNLRRLDELMVEEREVLGVLDNYNQYSHLLTRMYSILVQRKRGEEVERLMKEPLLRDENQPRSLRAWLYFQLIHYFYASFHQRYHEMHRRLSDSLNKIERSPSFLRDHLNVYANHLGLFLGTYAGLSGLDPVFDQALEKLRSLPDLYALPGGWQRIVHQEIIKSYDVELLLRLREADWEKAFMVAPRIEKMANDESVPDHHRSSFAYRLARLYFRTGNPSAALKWNNQALNIHPRNYRTDLLDLYRCFNLLLLYENRHEDVLTYALDSFQRYIAQRKNPDLFVREVFQLFRNLLRKADPQSILQHFLDKTQQLDSEDSADFIVWAKQRERALSTQ